MVTWNLDLDRMSCLKKRIRSHATTHPPKVGTDPGSHTSPLSSALASSCVTHTPRRSPLTAVRTGRLNICMLFTLRSTFRAGNSTVCPTDMLPCSTVPVSTVPWPLMGKQWSTAYSRGSSALRLSSGTRESSSATSGSMPSGGSSASPRSSAMVAAPPGRADTGTMGQPANRVALKVLLSFFTIFSTAAARVSAGSMSHLFRTTMSLSVVISPTTRHSAVCVCMPLFTSITSSIRSMICAPPSTVRMRLAWPGQSTSVNCRPSYLSDIGSSCGGRPVVKLLKPRSSVMPRTALSGCLSSAAVESWVLRARTREVLPLSTWPSTPTFTFKRRRRSASPAAGSASGVASLPMAKQGGSEGRCRSRHAARRSRGLQAAAAAAAA
mmetsp:Transcript_23189/g.78964  ORF Transcript_23189/g.78964 Transcript_23189/m.78964 type:complete len:381 (+) Transcript_23189:820-1962(+)